MKINHDLTKEVSEYLDYFCKELPGRSVGSEGNQMATLLFREAISSMSWAVESTPLQVMDWMTEGAELTCEGHCFSIMSSPYSLGCDHDLELAAASTIEELEQGDFKDKIILLHGEIAQEQIAPKNFVFWNPEMHQRIVRALEQSGVKAIICATGRNSATTGGEYPFPLFEDGDFNIPSVFMKDVEGEKLLPFCGKKARLTSCANRFPETAYNVIGRKGRNSQKRIVITAHIDAKKGTPGAIDNATGVIVLLLLADLLKYYRGEPVIELVAFNGEDYYAVPGQMQFIADNSDTMDNIILNINIDGAGYHTGLSSFSPFNLPEPIQPIFNKLIRETPEFVEGIPWVQGDHSIFVQYGRPAIAVSSQWLIENMENQNVTHTPKDKPSIVNPQRLVEISLGLQKFIRELALQIKS